MSKIYWRRLVAGMSLLSILFLVGGAIGCRGEGPEPVLVPLDDAQVVGKVWSGSLVWEPGFNQLTGDYFIVTKALIFKYQAAMAKIAALEKRIEELEIRKEN